MQTVMQNMKQGDPYEDAMRLVALRICELCFERSYVCGAGRKIGDAIRLRT